MIEDLENEDDLDFKGLDIESIKKNIPQFTSEKLCEMIVCDRYFGCYKEIAVMCMHELANRRSLGDTFDFENYIDNSYNELPVLDFSIPDLGDVLRQLVNKKVVL